MAMQSWETTLFKVLLRLDIMETNLNHQQQVIKDKANYNKKITSIKKV